MRSPIGQIRKDYALITRRNSALTGLEDIIIAGLAPYGTTAASEFITNAQYFREFARQAPADWKNYDLQTRLSTDVIEGLVRPSSY